MKEESQSGLACPGCGGRTYTWGQVNAAGLKFVPDGASSWWRNFSGGSKLRTRRCEGCGLLQLFSEPDMSRLGKSAREAARSDFS